MSEVQTIMDIPGIMDPDVKGTEETLTLDTVESRARSKFARKAGLPGNLGQWFEQNPDALREVVIWMEMAKAGETEWTLARLFREMVSEYGFPFSGPTNFGSYLRNIFPKQYPYQPNKNTAVR